MIYHINSFTWEVEKETVGNVGEENKENRQRRTNTEECLRKKATDKEEEYEE